MKSPHFSAQQSVLFGKLISTKLSTLTLVSTMTLCCATLANAEITNTVNAVGSSPSGTNDVNASAVEKVDVENAKPGLKVSKVADKQTDVEPGDKITYTYTVYNAGNVTLEKVHLKDVHEGSGTSPNPSDESIFEDNGTIGDSKDSTGDSIWDVLAPGDSVTWKATYEVTMADFLNNGGGDGAIDNTVTAIASSPGNDGDVSGQAKESIKLIVQKPSLQIAKVADKTTEAKVGDTITYTYTVTNNGNVPITNIKLTDTHNASGPAPVPTDETLLTDNGTTGDSTDTTTNGIWETLGVNDVVTFKATYIVTQSDVDTLQ